MAGFGAAKGRGGKKKLFDDRVNKEKDPRGALRMEKLHSAINYQPKERYPKISYSIPPPPTAHEKALVEQWKADRKKIREGPLFVRRVIDTNARVGKTAQTSNFNAFNGLATYSSRYERKYRQRPNHIGKLWLKEFLPRELWDVVDPSCRKNRTAMTSTANPNPAEPTPKTRFNIADFSDDEGGDINEELDDSDAERDAEAEEVDVDYEDDESDNDDYNAENYFEDGEKDDVVADDAEFGDDMGGGDEVHEREFGADDEFNV